MNGDSVYRGASFLAGKLGQKIAGDHVTVIDDGTMVGGFGTSPFDGEGIPTRRTVVIENGVLKSYLLNTYTAKKLGLQTTANASRGLAGTPGHRPRKLFSAARDKDCRKKLSPDIPKASTSPNFSATARTWSPATTRAVHPAFGSQAANWPIRSKKSRWQEI